MRRAPARCSRRLAVAASRSPRPPPPRRRRVQAARVRPRRSTPRQRAATFEARVRAARGSDRHAGALHAAGARAGAARWRRVVAGGPRRVADVARPACAATPTPRPCRTSPRRPPTARSCASAGSTPTARCSRARARRRGVCRQPDLRPDLVADADRRRAAPRRGRRAPLRRDACATRGPHRGRAVRGRAARRRAAALAAGRRCRAWPRASSASLTFTAPACAAGRRRSTSTVDAGRAVDERDEDDNVLVVPCPAGRRLESGRPGGR